jgi:hypothetical protein
MEEMMEQTGENGFHYVDEAAPPHWCGVGTQETSKIISDLVDKHSIRKSFLEICVYCKSFRLYCSFWWSQVARSFVEIDR